MKYKGYNIVESSGHGKACKGLKKSSSIQVRESLPDGYLLKKQFRFTIGDSGGWARAINAAQEYVDALTKNPLDDAIEELNNWLSPACPPEVKKAWKLVKETAKNNSKKGGAHA